MLKNIQYWQYMKFIIVWLPITLLSVQCIFIYNGVLISVVVAKKLDLLSPQQSNTYFTNMHTQKETCQKATHMILPRHKKLTLSYREFFMLLYFENWQSYWKTTRVSTRGWLQRVAHFILFCWHLLDVHEVLLAGKWLRCR